jgi:FkbM family methyltransferase
MERSVDYRPLPAAIRPLGRLIFRTWARTGKKASRLYRLIERWGSRLATHPLPTRLPNGCRIICDLREEIQRQIYFLGTFEATEAYLLNRLLRPGMVLVDAGANIGQHTLLAATAVGPSGSVHSFEPVPAVFAHLQSNVTSNGLHNVKLNRMALWNEDSTVTLALPAEHQHNSGAWTIGTTESLTAPVSAEAIRLDTYVSRCGLSRVDVIKMDIQGAEPFAMAGARDVLTKCRPALMMEVDRGALKGLGYSPEMLWDELSKLGYRAWRIRVSSKFSGPMPNLDGVEFDNFFFHYRDLPPEITNGWDRQVPKVWACSGWSLKTPAFEPAVSIQ